MLEFIAWYERASQWIYQGVEYVKQETRALLGPGPTQHILLADGRILPATVSIPAAVQETAYLYDEQTNRISSMGPAPEGRFRRLPFVSLRVEHPVFGTTDLTEWIGAIRANPVPVLPIQQILHLASLNLGRYIPIQGATIHRVNDEGTETVESL